MRINGHVLPRELVEDLKQGRMELAPAERLALRRMARGQTGADDAAWVGLFGVDRIENENRYFLHPDGQRDYGGQWSLLHRPGRAHVKRLVAFGSVGSDNPLALDYRTTPPRVIYLSELKARGCWLTMAGSYAAFRKRLTRATKVARTKSARAQG